MFCGGGPTTREDLFPVWLVNQVRADASMAEVTQQIGAQPSSTTRRGVGRRGLFRVRCVCAPCNNGWMSDLESANRRVLGALISDISMWLTRVDKGPLAAWAIKTAMAFESVSPQSEWFYTKD